MSVTTPPEPVSGPGDLPFDPNIILDWKFSAKKGDKMMEMHVPICQGTVRDAIERGVLTDGFPSMESTLAERTDVDGDGVREMRTPQPPATPQGVAPSGTVVLGAPVTTSAGPPAPTPMPKATADAGDADPENSDIFDNPEGVIKRFMQDLKFTWNVKAKYNPATGELEAQGWMAPGSEGQQVMVTPHSNAVVDTDPGGAGRVTVSVASGRRLVSATDQSGAPVRHDIDPIVTQAAQGAGNIVNNNSARIEPARLNGLVNGIGFLFNAALAAQFVVNISIAPGAGGSTSPP